MWVPPSSKFGSLLELLDRSLPEGGEDAVRARVGFGRLFLSPQTVSNQNCFEFE